MKKIENFRTLCDYYNKIVYKVIQLTEMCGNTDEAIKLRDDIEDMFTIKFSEPLDDVSDLQEELGFDLGKLQEINYIYAEDEENVLRKYDFIGVNFKENKIWFWCDFMPMYLDFENYKKTFWLKEDKSE